MCRGKARRGRAGQAFEFGEPGVVDGATANSLAADHRGPRQDDQAVKTKLLTGSCLRILDQGLGPTRARSSRNRPLEPLCTMAGLAQGWAGHPCHIRRMPLTSKGTPAPDVDAPCLVTRWANRNAVLHFTRSSLTRRRPWFLSPSNKALATVPFPVRDGRPFSRSPNFVLNTKGRAFRRQTTISNDLWAALVDEPMAQLHGCARRR